MRELEAFEKLPGKRRLGQNTLSMSLADALPAHMDEPIKDSHKARHDELFAQVRTIASGATDGATDEVPHDLCCRSTVLGTMVDTHHHAHVSGALALLATSGYRLDVSGFELPLGFAVKSTRVLIEIPPQTIDEFEMRVGEWLQVDPSARQYCFRLDLPELAADLRSLFPTLVDLARRSVQRRAHSGLPTHSAHDWLEGVLRQWQQKADPTRIKPGI